MDNRRLALGHKQLEENPWDTFESVFTRGSVHKCTILSKNDKGAVLELPYGIEGFATTKNLVKEDGSTANAGETLDFKVSEFSKDEKRIVLSHTAMHTEEKPRPQKKKGGPRSAVSKINKEVERDTLGDLEALSALKEQMEGDKKPAKKEAEAPKPKAKAAEAEVKEEKAEAPKEEAPVEEVKAEAPAEEAKEEKAEAPKAEKKAKPKAKAKAEEADAAEGEEKAEEEK